MVRYQHVLALCAFLTGVILKGLVLPRYVFNVYVCMNVLFHGCVGTGFVTDLKKALYRNFEKIFEM